MLPYSRTPRPLSLLTAWSVFVEEGIADADIGSGWSKTRVGVQDDYGYVHGRDANGCLFRGGEVTKTFTGMPSHSHVRVSLRFWAMDSWDWEKGKVYVDGERVFKAVRSPSVCGEFEHQRWHDSGCGGGTTCYSDIEVEVEHTRSSLELKVSTCLGSATSSCTPCLAKHA